MEERLIEPSLGGMHKKLKKWLDLVAKEHIDYLLEEYEGLSLEDLEQVVYLTLLEKHGSQTSEDFLVHAIMDALDVHAQEFGVKKGKSDSCTNFPSSQEQSFLTEASFRLEQLQVIVLLEQAIERLMENERLVLSLYYEQGLTYQNIAEVLNVSSARVGQLHQKSMLKVKAFFYQKRVL